MDSRKIMVLYLLLVVLSGCWKSDSKKQQKSGNDFYTATGGWDFARVPLIKPYVIKKLIDPKLPIHPWCIDFTSSTLLGPYNVKKVHVRDSIIYILSGKVDEKNDSTLVGTRNVPTGWFVIDTKQKTEKGFINEKGFYEYINSNNYSLPKWLDVDSLSNAFIRGEKLPWVKP